MCVRACGRTVAVLAYVQVAPPHTQTLIPSPPFSEPTHSQYASSGDAIASGDRDALSVVGILFDLDDAAPPNAALDEFLNLLTNVQYSGDTYTGTAPYDVSRLAPAEYLKAASARRAALLHGANEHILNNYR